MGNVGKLEKDESEGNRGQLRKLGKAGDTRGKRGKIEKIGKAQVLRAVFARAQVLARLDRLTHDIPILTAFFPGSQKDMKTTQESSKTAPESSRIFSKQFEVPPQDTHTGIQEAAGPHLSHDRGMGRGAT